MIIILTSVVIIKRQMRIITKITLILIKTFIQENLGGWGLRRGVG